MLSTITALMLIERLSLILSNGHHSLSFAKDIVHLCNLSFLSMSSLESSLEAADILMSHHLLLSHHPS